jgi:hypothetical protein
MNKWLSVAVLSLIFTLFVTLSVFAFENNEFQNKKELEAIKFLEDEIVEWVGRIYLSETRYTDKIIGKDIMWEQTTKIFVDFDIFNVDNTRSEIKELLLNETKVVYEVPVRKNEFMFMVTISKGLTWNENAQDYLDEDGIKRIKAEEGKWKIAKISSHQGDFSYDMEVNVLNKSNDQSDVVIVGGIPNINTPTAITIGDKIEQLVFIGSPPFDMNVEGNQVYSYDEVKTALNTMNPAGEDESSGEMSDMSASGNSIVIMLMAVVGLILLGIIVRFILKRREKRI